MVEIKNRKGEVIYRYDGSSLVGANLFKANLNNADLRGANLSGAYIGCADLNNVDLRGADLRESALYGASLRGANLNNADLRGSNLSGAYIGCADLNNADLRGANLRESALYGASLRGANLRESALYGASLRGANLRYANLSGADLSEVDLHGADLIDVMIDETTKGINNKCPKEGSFIGYKKCFNNQFTHKYIVELEILADARRSSSVGTKCRCDKAKVLSITNLDGSKTDITKVNSLFNPNFVYKVGKIVTEPNFDEKYWIECTSGIHFFMNRVDAVDY